MPFSEFIIIKQFKFFALVNPVSTCLFSPPKTSSRFTRCVRKLLRCIHFVSLENIKVAYSGLNELQAGRRVLQISQAPAELRETKKGCHQATFFRDIKILYSGWVIAFPSRITAV
jgi:hypothetical protein